jgi:hypothetical protein
MFDHLKEMIPIIADIQKWNCTQCTRGKELVFIFDSSNESHEAHFHMMELRHGNKAPGRGVMSTSAQQVGNLAVLVIRLVRQVRKHDPLNDVAAKAMDYLRREELDGSILRGIKQNMKDQHGTGEGE